MTGSSPADSAYPPSTASGAHDDLAEKLLDIIGRGAGAALPEREFDDLARAVFARQFEVNPIYRRYCQARGLRPETVGSWLDIPAVPTDAFKAAPLVSADPGSAEVVFRTSGTTGGIERRGEHYLRDTRFYRAALREGFHHAVMPEGGRMRILSLVPRFEDAPDSSLSFMLDEVLQAYGDEGSGTFTVPEGIRWEALFTALEEAAPGGVPVLLAGTSFAFVHLLDRMRDEGRTVDLPHGSRAMDTGGFKGRSREVGRDELYSRIEEHLAIPFAWIVNEYGMTEMSSQFYDGVAGEAASPGLARRHRGPGWVRSVAVDPESLEPLSPGEIGILRHLDPANIDSVMALQTADLGRVTDQGVELIGRNVGAPPRGCSIATDELLRLTRGR